MTRLTFALTALLLLSGCAANALPVASVPDTQGSANEPDPRNARLAEIAVSVADGSAPVEDHRIGPDDLIEVSVFDAPDVSGSLRVSSQGDVFVPLIGAVPAAGHSPESLSRDIEARLKGRFMVNPQVTVQVLEVNSRPVSVLGPVKQPGLIHLRGSRPLAEVLAIAGGLAPDAGDIVRITRAAPNGDAGTIDVNLSDLLESTVSSGRMVYVHPGDVVAVERAGVVYVVGEVARPGAFPLRGGSHLSALQAIALGGGMTRTASRRRVLVVRTTTSGERTTIPVDFARVASGGAPDLRLESNDVIFVPNSTGRMISLGAIDTMVRVITFRPAF
jgi:polysaccharide biosynthesis/export protein